MASALLLVLGGLALLVVGAEAFVRGAARLALRLGVTPLVVGLTIVALGTSSPELVVSLNAALTGRGDIALGNVVGSNICNLAFILGVATLVRGVGVQPKLLHTDGPLMVGASALLVGLLADGQLGRLDAGVLTAGLLAYLAWTIRQARRAAPTGLAVAAPAVADDLPVDLPVGRSVVALVVGLGLLVVGSRGLVEGAVTIAEGLGWSQAFIGLTVVAIGTSLPELATSVVAALRGHADLAVGNVVGSNLLNVLAILGPAALVQPMQASGLGVADLGVMLALSVLAVALMWSGRRLSRWEGGLLLGCYVGYMVYIVP